MPVDSREYHVPVLLQLHDSYSGSSGNHRYLTTVNYELQPSERAYISNLEDIVLETVHEQAHSLKVQPNNRMIVDFYELARTAPLGPPADSMDGRSEQYEVVDEAYLYRHAVLLNRLTPMKMLDPDRLIAIVEIESSARSTPLKEVNASEAQIRRELIASAAQKRTSSSTGATAKYRVDTQKTTRPDAVYNYRPLVLAPPSITIYHPVFSKFLQIMAEPQELTHEDLDRAQRFITQAVAYYQYESQREAGSFEMSQGVHPQLLLKRNLAYPHSGRTFELDDVVYSKMAPNGFCTVAAMTEVEVEVGEGSCDPIAKAECAYVAVYTSEGARPIREACCCPAFLVGMAGPNIIVSGAVFADQLIAQTLTDYISVIPRPGLHSRSPLDDTGYRVATLFKALKECIHDVSDFYEHLLQPMPTSRRINTGNLDSIPRDPWPSIRDIPLLRPASIISPHFSEYYNGAGEQVTLTYKKRLAPHTSSQAVFIAEAKSESESAKAIVKFAYKYGKKAHELLAGPSASQAPSCGTVSTSKA